MINPPIRPAAVTLLGGGGVQRCSCGHDVPIPDLAQPVTCPHCGRVWVFSVAIKHERRDNGAPTNPPA